MRRLTACCALSAALGVGCNSPPAPPATPPPVAPPTESVSEAVDRSETEPMAPVYSEQPNAVDPLAARLCKAIHARPAEQRASCCGRPVPKDPGGQFETECARLVSIVLAERSVALNEAAVTACEAALVPQQSVCEDLGRLATPMPAACLGVFEGKRADGAACRSSLECAGTNRCVGAGPTDRGVCARAGGPGRACAIAVDVLATYTRQTDLDARHPECEGICQLHRCAPPMAEGAACRSTLQCGPGRFCVEGLCRAQSELPAGAKCSGGGCVAGLRCIGGQCAAPKPTGEPCANDFECRGACLKATPMAPAGQCGPYCR